MDVIRFLSNRQIDIINLLSVEEQINPEENYNGMITALGNALEKQVRTWWDICTIEHYLKEQIIVRSLRWEVAPQNGLDDPESMAEWLRLFNGVVLRLQELILQRKE